MNRLSKKIEEILNSQIAHEYSNVFFYQRIAQSLEFNGWFGAAKLFKKYSAEEVVHAEKLMSFMQDMDCYPEVPPVAKMDFTFKDIEQVAKAAYDREAKTTDMVNAISLAALSEKDITTHTFIQWFVNEQIEELGKTLYWIDRIEMMKKNGASLFFIDEEMGDKA